ncbi:MAG: chorismate synthase [Bdellovibrio sp.]|nr:chorismate synthase [Bdellovibrio sp.]
MSANTFGQRFQLTSFGESHGVALGAIIEGCPAGVHFDFAFLNSELQRRRPGQSAIVTGRNEDDLPEVLSGVYEGKTLGTPIAIIVRNKDQRSDDYKEIATKSRPGHADDLWREKFGHTDHRGGGRSSGRETLSRVIGGAIARMVLKEIYPELKIFGFATSIGPITLDPQQILKIESDLIEKKIIVDQFSSRLPDQQKNIQAQDLLLKAKTEGHSYGGTAEIFISGAPVGLGQPVFHKLKSDLAAAFMSVGATAGVELGDGQDAAEAEGSQFHRQESQRHYGGIRGGISSGEPILFRVSFKPTSTVLDAAKKGRHDPCIVIRATPVLESMAALVILDHVLWARQDKV